MRPLEDITVITFEHAIAAPFCTRQLADLGARVIKIERPGSGDFARHYDQRVRGLSSHFVWTNRSKESLALDIKRPQARDIINRLLSRADVLVQNLIPGAAARLGLDYDTLREHYPRLIVCDISGYGGNGPYRDKKAYDLLIQAESGFVSVTGSTDEPSKAGNSIADISAGMYAYTNILTALIQRARSKTGSHIDISMLECMVEWMGYPLYYGFEGATPPPRTGANHATIYPYGPFSTADKKSVIIGIQNEREWDQFCRIVLQQAELAADQRFAGNSRRVEMRDQLREIIVRVFSRLSLDNVIDRLEQGGIAWARVNEISEVWSHPQLKARGRWVDVETAVGKIPALLPPGMPGVCEPRMDAVPGLGQHTDSILSELGYDNKTIAGLRDEQVIG